MSGADRAFLSAEEIDRFVPACCAMANGAGGWVVFPVTEGSRDAGALEKLLADVLRDARLENVSVAPSYRVFPDLDKELGPDKSGKKVLNARVEPAAWRLRPVRAGKDKRAYRRVEGENVISGRGIRWRMALDALETSRDDFAVPGMALSDLDGGSVASFRDKLTLKFPGWNALSGENFLKRALVLDEDGMVTRAGELLLGKNSNLVRVSNKDVPNLWSACEIFLPQVAKGVTAPCAAALRECFVNAVLHAEHDAGVINVEVDGGTALFSNPGLPRSLESGKSEARNYRLMRIFVMAGLAGGEGRGLETIRAYDAGFSLSLDTLELATVCELRLLAADTPAGGEYVQEPKLELAEPEKPSFADPGWMPVVQKKLAADEEDDEYLGTDYDSESWEFSPLVRQVRDTPRMAPDVVRDAIMELCSEYKSLVELAVSLARSEGSLRRHYITSMVKDGLLEMEFPDRVGHPDQRYRTI